MVTPAEPRGELSEKTKAEINAGQVIVAKKFLENYFDPEKDKDK